MRWRPPTALGYVAMIATMIVARLWLAMSDAGPMIESQGLALSWLTLLILALLGWGTLFLAERVGFAAEWERRGPVRRWYALAVIVAVVYGVLSASGDVGVWAQHDGNPAVLEAFGTDDVHQRFPDSIPFYYYGGVFMEIFLRLIGLTVITWLLGLVVGRSRVLVAFWIANVVVSLYEPWPFLENDLDHAPAAAWPSIISDHLLGELYLANLFSGYLYWRSGLWTAVIFRYSYYVVWHVVYGSFRTGWLEIFLG